MTLTIETAIIFFLAWYPCMNIIQVFIILHFSFLFFFILILLFSFWRIWRILLALTIIITSILFFIFYSFSILRDDIIQVFFNGFCRPQFSFLLSKVFITFTKFHLGGRYLYI